MKETRLVALVDRMRELLERGQPFARHVSACDNHDGLKFQALAEEWLEDVEYALSADEKSPMKSVLDKEEK
jgi:hypothetical protein